MGLLNLFRLKAQRNKRSEPYYHPFIMKSVERRETYDPVLRNTTLIEIANIFLVAAILPELENIRTDVGISLQGSFY